MNYKYMRIQGREGSYITKYPKGIFSLCWNLVNDGVMEQSENEWQSAVKVKDGEMIY